MESLVPTFYRSVSVVLLKDRTNLKSLKSKETQEGMVGAVVGAFSFH